MPLVSHAGFGFGLENPQAYIWLVAAVSGLSWRFANSVPKGES